jgi:hypothetical protein
MYNRQIVPESFTVPQNFKTSEFMLEPLTVNNLIKDYDAVMSSVSHLTGLMGNNDEWPCDLTLEENLIDLGWHQREFTLRHSFAYSVMSLDATVCLGCCYIYPSSQIDFDVQAFYWIRKEYLDDGLETRLGLAFQSWLETDWPFSKIDYPGRNL